MLNIASWIAGWRSLRRQGLRVFLSGLAITSATALMLGLLTTANITTSFLRSEITRYEKNSLLSFSNQSQTHKNQSSTSISLEKLEDIFTTSEVEEPWAASYTEYHKLHINGKRSSISLYRATHNFIDIHDLNLAQGRKFDIEDVAHDYQCIVGHKIAQQLAQKNPNLDQWFITLQNKRYQVIGVLQKQDDTQWVLNNLDNAAIALINTAEAKMHHIEEVVFSLAESMSKSDSVNQLKALMENNFPTVKFNIFDAAKVIGQFRGWISFVEGSFYFIGLISIALSSFNIVNSMLANIFERREEIGIRLAVGAQPHHIRNLFMQEIIILCGISAIIGISASIGCVRIVDMILNMGLSIRIDHVILSFCTCMGIGLFAGLYPTHHAKNIKPIDVIHGI